LVQVDDLFRRAWLYFDQIIVSDEISPQLAHMPDEPSDQWRANLLDNLRIAVHLREIGAEKLVGFQTKSHRGYCQEHARQALGTLGLSDIEEYIDEYVQVIEPDIQILTFTKGHGEQDLTYSHPRIGPLIHKTKVDPEAIGKDIRAYAARDLVLGHISGLIVDVSVANELKIPLGTVDQIQAELMSKHASEPDVAKVAFELDLPVLEDISIADLLKIRDQEADAFEIFRARLRNAIGERLRIQPGSDARAVAEKIKQDVIVPELHSIRRRLTKAQSTLAKKMGLGTGVGTLVTSCGLLTGLFPVALTGIGIVATASVIPGQQYFERKAEVEMSDMYFLWQALQHAK
jgi:hypothetical protein